MSTPELALFKSSYSSSSGEDCVEVAATEQVIHVRDSEGVTRPHFAVRRDHWTEFVVSMSEA